VSANEILPAKFAFRLQWRGNLPDQQSDLVASVTARAFTFDAPIPLAGNLATSIEPAASPDGAFDTANWRYRVSNEFARFLWTRRQSACRLGDYQHLRACESCLRGSAVELRRRRESCMFAPTRLGIIFSARQPAANDDDPVWQRHRQLYGRANRRQRRSPWGKWCTRMAGSTLALIRRLVSAVVSTRASSISS